MSESQINTSFERQPNNEEETAKVGAVGVIFPPSEPEDFPDEPDDDDVTLHESVILGSLSTMNGHVEETMSNDPQTQDTDQAIAEPLAEPVERAESQTDVEDTGDPKSSVAEETEEEGEEGAEQKKKSSSQRMTTETSVRGEEAAVVAAVAAASDAESVLD